MNTILKRVAWTFGITFVGALPIAVNLAHDNLKAIGLTALGAGIAAAISAVKTAVWKPSSPSDLINIVERGAWSAVQGAVAALPTTITYTKGGLVAAAWMAASGAASAILSVAKNASLAGADRLTA